MADSKYTLVPTGDNKRQIIRGPNQEMLEVDSDDQPTGWGESFARHVRALLNANPWTPPKRRGRR